MARARAIETRLEKLVPALDEYYSSGFLTREETLEVSRQRTHWEYRLVAKPLLLLDVRGAVTYELGLEKRLGQYCNHAKLNLRHRWDILERIEGIYKIGIKHLKNKKEHEALRQEFVLFLQQFQRNGSLSNLYGELMVTYPRRSDIWVEAAEWQCSTQHNTDNARAILQQALLTMSSEPAVWACALRVELRFVQRLLDGLLAEHHADIRKARKKATDKSNASAKDEGQAEAEEVSSAAGDEPTSVIAPKLRAENASMGQVLLDLALAKTVVEEAFNSPASGALLAEQLLSTAGAFAFSKEVMEQIVSISLEKMLEACVAADAPRGDSAGVSAASLSIVSQQQQLRVRVQWRHRQSIDVVLAAYLSLEDALVNRYATALVDAATYLAEGGSEAVANARRCRQSQNGRQDEKGYAEFSFANPSPDDRRRASLKSLVSITTFAALPVSVLSALHSLATAELDATQRFLAVRQALADVLRRLAGDAPEGVSKVCGALLRGSSGASLGKAKTSKKGEQTKAVEAAEVARWILRRTKLDKATLTSCVDEPQERVARLTEAIAAAECVAPPPTSRARTEASPAAAPAESSLLTWSVMQLERFLRAEDRDVLRSSSATTVDSPTSARSPSSSAAASPLNAEAVERFVVWWKEEEAQLQSAPIVSAAEVAASQARRRMAVVELLQRYGLLPTTAVSPVSNNSSKGKGVQSASARLAETDVWAAAETYLLTRTTALQYRPAASHHDDALPLSAWRIFSALETMLGPLNPNAPTFANAEANGSNAKRKSDSSSDEDEDGIDSGAASSSAAATAQRGGRLSSFAAAGLHFLSGVPSSVLDRTQEWVRLEGVTSLLRCRLASWLGSRVCTRETVASVLRGATAEAANGWVADLQGLLTLAQRCQPLPRYAQTHCILPFLEGVALYYASKADSSAAVVRSAVQAAREAHEALLKLYTVSKHPEAFLPLVYDGTSARKLLAGEAGAGTTSGKASTVAVQQANTEDWVAYVVFERAVSKDLLRAKTVVEQGRRQALSPQLFMVRLNAL